MKQAARLSRLIILALGGLVLFCYLVYLFLPAGRINTCITRNLENQGLVLTPEAGKALLPGLIWRDARLASPQGALAAFNSLILRPRLTSLLAGHVRFNLTGEIREGRFDLDYALNGRDALRFTADGINLADIPFFKTALSGRVAGELWSQGSARRVPQGLDGELKLEVKRLEFSGVTLGGVPLPDAANLRSQGMARIAGNRVRLESFTIQGDGVFMRLSGEIPGTSDSPLNLILEIMPKADFYERQKLVFMLLAKFMVSPGNYRVPIRGTLLKPSIF